MKHPLTLALLAVLPGLPLLAADAPIPESHPVERYARIWTKSPFTVASVIAADTTPQAGFTDSLTLVGIATVNGQPLVTIKDNNTNLSQLVTSEANADGLKVVSFKNDLDPSKVEIVLNKSGTDGTLRFNVASFGANSPANPNPQNPPQAPNGTVPPPTMPANIRVPRPGVQVPQPNNTRRRRIALPGANQRPRQTGSGTIPPPSPR